MSLFSRVYSNSAALNCQITPVDTNQPHILSLSFAPGRFLVAESGLLITRIVNTKKNGGINYIITDAGMNTLLRPSFYNTSHQIDVINKSSSEKIDSLAQNPNLLSSFYADDTKIWEYKLAFKNKSDLNIFLKQISENKKIVSFRTSMNS